MCTLHFAMAYVLLHCTLCDVYVLKTLRFGTLTLCAATFCNITSCDVYVMLLVNWILGEGLVWRKNCDWVDGRMNDKSLYEILYLEYMYLRCFAEVI
jgi:hypothetical protein